MAKQDSNNRILVEQSGTDWTFTYIHLYRENTADEWDLSMEVDRLKVDCATLPGFGLMEEADPESIAGQAFVYGVRKKLDDSTSSIPASEKLAERASMLKVLQAGKWERDRKGGTRTVPLVVEALAKLKGIGVASAQTAWRDTSKTDREKLLAAPKVMEAMAEIKASREADAVSFSDLLS